MARGRKKKAAVVRPNTATPEMIQLFVKDIERLTEEMDSKKGEYMAWCKGHRELINRQYDAANNAGIPRKSMKATIKTRALESKIEKIADDLAEDETAAETFEQIRAALGDLADTPLGKAASGEQPSSEDEWNRAGAENAAKVAAGIKGLPGADAVHA